MGMCTPLAARSRRLRTASGLALALVAAPAGDALADDVDACVTASDEGQQLRDEGRLRAARERFVACAAERCPGIVRKDCAAWLGEVEEKLPTVAIHARDAEGRDVADVRVSVDGELLAERLDGRALPLDPGTRTFRFVRPGAPEVVSTLLLREGEKGRLVDVVLGAPAAPPPAPARPIPIVPAATWALGAISLATLGAGLGFGASAKLAVDDMRRPDGCAPSCDPARLDAVRRDALLANVLFATSAAALVAGAVVTLVHVRSRPASAPVSDPSGPVAWQLAAGPGTLWLSGSF